MRFVVTATIDGREVGRATARATDCHNMISQLAYNAMALQRDEQTNEIAAFKPILITIDEVEG